MKERVCNNKKVIQQLNTEQLEWLENYLKNSEYNLSNCVLKLVDGVLLVITNTINYRKQFKRMEGECRWD